MAHSPTPPASTGLGTKRQSNFWVVSKYPDFKYLWVGNFFTVGAQWIQVLTVGWLVLAMTDGNAFLTGTAVGIRTLPILLIGPWVGVLADRIDRRKFVMVTQIGMAIAALIFAFMVLATDLDADPISGPLKWWHAFIYMGVSGIAHSIVQPVRQAMVPNTVPREALGSALALNGIAHPSMRIVGPSLGGILIAVLGFNWNFFIEAGFYVTIVLAYMPMKLPYREPRSSTKVSMLDSMREGLAYVVKEKTIRQLIVMAFIPNLVFQPVVFVLPIFTTQVLGRGADAGGVLAAAVGAGGIVAAIIIATNGFIIRRGPATLVGLVGGCFFILLFSQSHWYFASIGLLAGLGFFQYMFRVGNNTLIQTIVPDAIRGRVMSIYMLDNGITPLSTMVISFFIYIWSPTGTYTVLASISLVLALMQFAFFKRVRQLE
ncbi:MAG: MFS transporter [SAR202 cluster bacterium]|nr:MFS transporter [SAR202 cluster bacterium]